MDPNWNKQEQEIIRLLGKLGATDPEYPAEKLSKRRAAFVASIGVAAAGGAIGAKSVASLVAKLLKAAQVEKIVIGVELATILGLATYLLVTTYLQRDELRNPITVPPTATATVMDTPLPSTNLVPPTQIPSRTATSTPTSVSSMTATSTASPVPTSTFKEALGEGTQAFQSTSVQEPIEGPGQPNAPPTKDNSGLHLGQTKQPTKKP